MTERGIQLIVILILVLACQLDLDIRGRFYVRIQFALFRIRRLLDRL